MSGIRAAVTRTLRRVESNATGLRIHEFDAWNETLDQALATLPIPTSYDADLYRALAEPRGSVVKKIALVTSRDRPVAVAALRSTGGPWEPVTTWVVPGLPFPCEPGRMLDALHALALPMQLAWWRCETDPPSSTRVAPDPAQPTYRLPADFDAEAHWRTSSLIDDVRKARKRCETFRVAFDVPDASEWVIRNWGTSWRVATNHVEDMVVSARMLTAVNRYHNIMIYDGDRAIGGATQLVDSGDLVGQAVFRDPAYEKHSLGTFIIDRVFAWVAKSDLKGLDFGGTDAYKERWAPPGGRKFVVHVTPHYVRAGIALRRLVRFR